ncbi:MAG TPA: HNH endonuclease [Candidatus Corynebacterium gallistercoris]|uniref:HNH endonuclease n=1 Tax=Candidatus Corynebacterium gallistercoris TaxID=2838530 RepID=A0A9D1S037_9CORY|nr:HNH endonuclease [Candidatus Corynebacterium gallistercoris]
MTIPEDLAVTCNKVELLFALSVVDDPCVSRIQSLRRAGRRDAAVFAHAAQIITRMPTLWEEVFEHPTIGVRHLDAIWRAGHTFDGVPDAFLEDHMLDLLASRSGAPPAVSEVKNHLERMIAHELPDIFAAAEGRRDAAKKATKDGNTWRLTMPAGLSQMLWESITKAAKKIAKATGQELPEARMEAIAHRLGGQAEQTVVHVHVYRMEGGPGFIPGVGTISREAAEWYQTHAATVSDVQAPEPVDRYSPTAAQRAYVAGRDGTCRFMGCEVPATLCDKDHIEPYNHEDPARGGPTDVRNLQCLCRTHHNLKTNGLWHAETPDGGWTIHWTNRHGETFTTYANGVITPDLDL